MERNAAGRPKAPGVTDALLQTAERLMASDGFDSLTVERLVSEVGTTRPTFYRRFPNITALAIEVITRRFGTGSPVATGSLELELLSLQREDIEMFSSPLIQHNLPGLLGTVRTNSEARNRLRNGLVEPRRANVRDLLLSAVDRGEIPNTNTDVEYVCDLLMGPLLARALLPLDGRLDDDLAKATVRTVMDHLVGNARGVPGSMLPGSTVAP